MTAQPERFTPETIGYYTVRPNPSQSDCLSWVVLVHFFHSWHLRQGKRNWQMPIGLSVQEMIGYSGRTYGNSRLAVCVTFEFWKKLTRVIGGNFGAYTFILPLLYFLNICLPFWMFYQRKEYLNKIKILWNFREQTQVVFAHLSGSVRVQSAK